MRGFVLGGLVLAFGIAASVRVEAQPRRWQMGRSTPALRRPASPTIPRDLRSAPDMWVALPGTSGPIAASSASYSETLGQDFELVVHVSPTDSPIASAAVVGQPVAVGIRTSGTAFRILRGFVRSMSETREGGARQQSLRILPWTSLMRLTSNNAVYEGVSVPEILRRVLRRYPFADFEFRLRARYPVQELIAQYRETDGNFFQRLVEHAGITYFFEHTSSGERLVLVDGPNAVSRTRTRPAREAPRLVLSGTDPASAVDSWSSEYEVVPSRYRLTDQNLAARGELIVGDASAADATAYGALVMTDQPGGFQTQPAAQLYAERRLDELRGRAVQVSGTTQSPHLRAGYTFRVVGEGGDDLGEFHARTISTMWNYEPGSPLYVRTSFQAIPATTTYRPSRNTPWPTISGVQVATVVGRTPGQLETDPAGRVRVRFGWVDTAGDALEAWVRAPGLSDDERPRVGDQVIIAFLEGEPSIPVIQAILSRP